MEKISRLEGKKSFHRFSLTWPLICLYNFPSVFLSLSSTVVRNKKKTQQNFFFPFHFGQKPFTQFFLTQIWYKYGNHDARKSFLLSLQLRRADSRNEQVFLVDVCNCFYVARREGFWESKTLETTFLARLGRHNWCYTTPHRARKEKHFFLFFPTSTFLVFFFFHAFGRRIMASEKRSFPSAPQPHSPPTHRKLTSHYAYVLYIYPNIIF